MHCKIVRLELNYQNVFVPGYDTYNNSIIPKILHKKIPFYQFYASIIIDIVFSCRQEVTNTHSHCGEQLILFLVIWASFEKKNKIKVPF